jgi:hypothetical protein
MAIDSREKRQSIACLSGSPYFGPTVTPNTEKDKEWRQEVGYGYPGIAAIGELAVLVRMTMTAKITKIKMNGVKSYLTFEGKTPKIKME